jgi:hypothetical protein
VSSVNSLCYRQTGKLHQLVQGKATGSHQLLIKVSRPGRRKCLRQPGQHICREDNVVNQGSALSKPFFRALRSCTVKSTYEIADPEITSEIGEEEEKDLKNNGMATSWIDNLDLALGFGDVQMCYFR